MEKNRILYAAAGWLILLVFLSSSIAQETPPDRGKLDASEPDTSSQENAPIDDTLIFTPIYLPEDLAPDTFTPKETPPETFAIPLDSAAVLSPDLTGDSRTVAGYQARVYLSKGPSDEVKNRPCVLVSSTGSVGSAAIPLDYLNGAGLEVRLNDLPFPYNGIYRPYLIGVDLNTIPWEILNSIESDPFAERHTGLNFLVGPPADRANRSDVEVSRGPYGYTSSRWRFFRPFGNETFAYFTLGFKKSIGLVADADYNGHHVTGGITRKMAGGTLSLDLWSHRARTGLPAFDFLVTPQSRQSRALNRAEIRFNRQLVRPYYLYFTGLYHRSDQTIYGFTLPMTTKYDIGGGEFALTDSLDNGALTIGGNYYKSILYGLSGNIPRGNQFGFSAGYDNSIDRIQFGLGLAYDWDDIDKGVALPIVSIKYDFDDRFAPFVKFSRSRRQPDLYLRNLSDSVPNLNIAEFARSYRFMPRSNLSSPLFTQGTLGFITKLDFAKFEISGSYKKIDSQIFLAYAVDSSLNMSVSPRNFDDSYFELLGSMNSQYGIFAGELSGCLKSWDERYLPDGTEKVPQASGFGRVSFLKQIFVPRLYIGGSLEARFASRREFRSITRGFVDPFAVVNGRLEFRYKDFVFWLNDDNLANAEYITWWPFYESPRVVWWGFRWSFFD